MFVLEEPEWLSLVGIGAVPFGGDGDGDGDGAGDLDDSDDEVDESGGEDDDSDDSDYGDDGDDQDDDVDDEDDDDEDDDEDEDDDDEEADVGELRREIRSLNRDLDEALDIIQDLEDRLSGEDGGSEGREAELEERVEELEALLNGQLVRNAISSFKNKDGSKRWDWEDPEIVFRLLDADDIDIDIESGEIDGLEEQLVAIAKQKPFLLRDGQRTPGGSTGSRPGGGTRRGKKDEMTAEDWVAKRGPAYSILTR